MKAQSSDSTDRIGTYFSLTASVIGNSTCPADRRIAAGASREGLGESDDEASSHCGDRVGDLPFGSKRRRLWVGNRWEWQIPRAARRNMVLRGGMAPCSAIKRGQRTICPKSYANGRRTSHSNCMTTPTHWPVPTSGRHWKAQQLHCRKLGVCASQGTARDY